MEYLSETNLENYQHIIKQIEDERHKNEELQGKISDLNKKIIAKGLTLRPDFAREKIFKVLVKIFSSIFEIYELYSEKISRQEIESLSEFRNRKFYFVEIYVSRTFQEKIFGENWAIIVRVENSRCCVNKSVNLKTKVLNPICLVVPFDASTEESLVEVTIAWRIVPTDCGPWPNLKIASIPIDISYHIESCSDFKVNNDATLDLLRISKLYNSKIPCSLLRPSTLSYKISCRLSAREFFEAIVKNCYHKFDPRKKSSFSSDDKVATVKFFAGGPNSASLKLDASAHVLQVEATPQDLYKLKKFLLSYLHHQCGVDENTRGSLSDLKRRLGSDDQLDEHSVSEMVEIYNELRGLLL